MAGPTMPRPDPARRILYLSGTRADFGLMASALHHIQATDGLSLQIAVTGMHLSRAHGHTVDEVRASGLPVCAEIPLDMDTRTGESMALGVADCLRGMCAVLARERPDALLLLGDRGEMLAGAIAALHLGVACVHLHGGERSGTVDEPVRHAISKLSSYHFVATAESRDRLVRMGEAPDTVHVTGAPGLDGLLELGERPRADVLAQLGLPADARFVLAVFHPVVQQADDASIQTEALRAALEDLGLPVLWLDPNADAGSRAILDALAQGRLPAGSRRCTHLGRPLFAEAMRHCELMVGNSSAGIIEAATFGTPVVNVGDRQRERERSPNIVDVPAETPAILAALRRQQDHGRWPCENPWGDGRAGERIANLLLQLPLTGSVLEKTNAY